MSCTGRRGAGWGTVGYPPGKSALPFRAGGRPVVPRKQVARERVSRKRVPRKRGRRPVGLAYLPVTHVTF